MAAVFSSAVLSVGECGVAVSGLGSRICSACAGFVFALTPCASLAAEADTPNHALFEKRIRPVLVEHCYKCHGGGKEIKGGLRLDTRQGWESGGDSGPPV